MSITGGSFRPLAVFRSYSVLARSSDRPISSAAFYYRLLVAFGAQFQEILLRDLWACHGRATAAQHEPRRVLIQQPS